MKAKFLLDEQISPSVANHCRKAGMDIIAAAGSTMSGQDDEGIFRAAIQEGRIVVTYDIGDFVLLFSALLKEGLDVPGLVLVDSRSFPTSEPKRLARALSVLASRIQAGDADPSGGLFLTR